MVERQSLMTLAHTHGAMPIITRDGILDLATLNTDNLDFGTQNRCSTVTSIVHDPFVGNSHCPVWNNVH